MMSDVKFTHCADLHLGSRFAGVSDDDPQLGKRLRESIFDSFGRIIDCSLQEDVDFMVISGDIYDEKNESASTRQRFAEELRRFGKPCFICLGNHDYKQSQRESIPYPDNVHVFPTECERIDHDVRGNVIEIIGRSFPSRHFKGDLTEGFSGSNNRFTIGVVHCDLDAGRDSEYAPCRSSDLVGRNIDYWALGHIHERKIANECPHIVYPGNIQGRSSKEDGEKGAYIVTIRDDRVFNLEFISTQKVIWKNVKLDITGKTLTSLNDELRSKVPKGSIVRLEIIGRGDLNRELRRDRDLTNQFERTTESIITSVSLRTRPNLELNEGNQNFMTMAFFETKCLDDLSKDEIIEVICSTKASERIRDVFQSMDLDELRGLVFNARMQLIDMIQEESE